LLLHSRLARQRRAGETPADPDFRRKWPDLRRFEISRVQAIFRRGHCSPVLPATTRGSTTALRLQFSVIALVIVMKGRRLEYVVKGIAVTPIRYALLVSELVTLARFASDMWLTGNLLGRSDSGCAR
jgi:hypothetical protein